VPPRVSLCVILAGGIKPSPLVQASGKSVLDAFVTPTQTVLGTWTDRVRTAWGGSKTPRIVVVHGGPGAKPAPDAGIDVEVQQDNTEFRGPAGAVRDAATEEDPGSFILVIEGASFLRSSLDRLFVDPADSAAAAVGICADRTPAGLYLLRRDLLNLVPPIGFMDLKEQFLEQAREAGHRIVVRDMGDQAIQRLWTRRDLLAASNARRLPTTASNGKAGKRDAQAIVQPGLSSSCICRGSRVAEDALMVDSMVMPGATVGARAVVVRTVLFEGARVEPGEIVLDQMISANGRVGSGGQGMTGVLQR
jgi:hypothetical protein